MRSLALVFEDFEEMAEMAENTFAYSMDLGRNRLESC